MKKIMKCIISSYLLINCKLKRANKSISSFLLLSFKIFDRIIKKYFNVVGGLLFQIHEQQIEKTGTINPDLVFANERKSYVTKVLEDCDIGPDGWNTYAQNTSLYLDIWENVFHMPVDETDPELYELVCEYVRNMKIASEEAALREIAEEEALRKVAEEAALRKVAEEAVEEEALRKVVEKTGTINPDLVFANERKSYVTKVLEDCDIGPDGWNTYAQNTSLYLDIWENVFHMPVDETDPELYELVCEYVRNMKIASEEAALREIAEEEALRKVAEEAALREVAEEAIDEELLRKVVEEIADETVDVEVLRKIIEEIVEESALRKVAEEADEKEALRKQVEAAAELTQEIPLDEKINPNLDSVCEMIDFDSILESENGFIVNEELRQFFEISVSISQKSLIHVEYFTILIYLLFAILLSFVILGFSYLFVVQNPETEKMSAYECGFEPYEDARQKFDVKFYIVAMLFIIFDIETMYLIPWCVSLPYINSVGYFVMMEFILELCVGFLYVWYIGGLEWD